MQVTYCLGVVSFGFFCYLLGSSKCPSKVRGSYNCGPCFVFRSILSREGRVNSGLYRLLVLIGKPYACFCAGPQDIPYLYCFFFITVAPLRWIYYRIKKWHYYLLVSFSASLITPLEVMCQLRLVWMSFALWRFYVVQSINLYSSFSLQDLPKMKLFAELSPNPPPGAATHAEHFFFPAL